MQPPNPTSTKPATTSIGLLLWAILICLTIPAPGHAQVAEICANGIDDDGDTLIDCDDPDCNFPLFSDGSYGNSKSHGVALGDLDGDGDLDAWVANYFSQANRVWINQGGDQGRTPGTYADSGQSLGNSPSRAVALGDLDGDGDLDAWVANYSDSSGFGQANRVWINQGGDQGGILGTYADSNQDLGNSSSADVALGDLDGDGDLDAWVGNYDTQANRVWINQGGDQGGTPGTYADSGQALGNSDSTGVALGDLDGDGDLDAWVANWNNQANRVWINQIFCFNDDDADGISNECDIDITLGPDCDSNGEDDTCQTDTDSDGTIDPCDNDLDGDGIPNTCDLDQTQGFDCNGNSVDDLCDIDSGLAADCNTNGIPDECEYSVANDCNSNGILDACENLPLIDCNGNGIQDLCEIVTNQAADCDGNGVPDSCQYATDPDCNSNGILDACDIALGFNDDCDGNGVPDVCDFANGGDGDGNGILDDCEQALFQRGDGNGDGSVDISDAIFQLEVLFGSRTSTCDDAGDSNDDGSLNIADSVYLLAHLFNNGPNPQNPFPTCGPDPTEDLLGCESFGVCP
ncbi:FG-GAP-like repeat-containing protein [Planctomycetota bacterium]|nr:FG-GAP-like repeat-containing protein [Planctomycetota bacterium]